MGSDNTGLRLAGLIWQGIAGAWALRLDGKRATLYLARSGACGNRNALLCHELGGNRRHETID